MAIIAMEGFDHFTNGAGSTTELQYERKYKGTKMSNISAHSSTTPNSQGYSLSLATNGAAFCPYFGDYYGSSSYQYSVNPGTVGFHYRSSDISLSSTQPFLQICYLTPSQVQIEVRVEPSNGKLLIYNGGGSLLGQSSYGISSSTWYYIELKYSISNSISSDSNVLRVNGSDWLNLTAGTDTQYQGGSSVNCIKLVGGTDTRLFDNFYLSSSAGFLNQGGGVFVKTIYPESDGNSSDFTPSVGSNWNAVNDTAPNDDTDYNEASTNDSRDLFVFEDISIDPDIDTVIAVASVIYGRRSTPRNSSIYHSCRSSAANYDAAYKYNALNQNYDYYQYIWGSNPAGGSWTPASVAAAEFGYKLSSSVDSTTEAI